MEELEKDLEEMMKDEDNVKMLKNFAFTVTIPKFKNVWYNDSTEKSVKKKFGKLSNKEQEGYYKELIKGAEKITNEYQDTEDVSFPVEYYFEKFPTNPWLLHMHGIYYEKTQESIKRIQELWAKTIGYKYDKQKNDCIYIRELHGSAGVYAWQRYIKKDQNFKEVDRLVEIAETEICEEDFHDEI